MDQPAITIQPADGSAFRWWKSEFIGRTAYLEIENVRVMFTGDDEPLAQIIAEAVAAHRNPPGDDECYRCGKHGELRKMHDETYAPSARVCAKCFKHDVAAFDDLPEVAS